MRLVPPMSTAIIPPTALHHIIDLSIISHHCQLDIDRPRAVAMFEQDVPSMSGRLCFDFQPNIHRLRSAELVRRFVVYDVHA
jgi:hypothetical protein